MLVIDTAAEKDVDRTEAYAEFAKKRAEGQVFFPPTMLPPEERRLHVRRTLREDHQFRIKNHPEDAQAKFDKLAESPFIFFRGTSLLYYRDYAGMDSYLPIVFTVGDVHPENFGVMPNEDGAPFFGINDFDEAYFAPFSWDVKRGATGFYMAAQDGGLSSKKSRKVVDAFVKGYLEGLQEFARDDREKWHEYRLDNSPTMIRELIASAMNNRKGFLEEFVDLEKGLFVSSDEIVPHSKHVPQFQKAIEEYLDQNEIDVQGRAGHFKVKDVAIKKGSGTASLGLERYYVLLDGPTDDPADDIILEIKQARESALKGLAPEGSVTADGKAERIMKSHHIHLAGGDAYYGRVCINDQSFTVREHSPYKDKIKIDDLSHKEFREYATICGETLAQAHARSDEDTGVMEGSAEKQILASINLHVFQDDVVRFAEMAVQRICADYKLFKKDHALGAFNFVRTNK
jgi:uncharacterized protein (DUF2252 family)